MVEVLHWKRIFHIHYIRNVEYSAKEKILHRKEVFVKELFYVRNFKCLIVCVWIYRYMYVTIVRKKTNGIKILKIKNFSTFLNAVFWAFNSTKTLIKIWKWTNLTSLYEIQSLELRKKVNLFVFFQHLKVFSAFLSHEKIEK